MLSALWAAHHASRRGPSTVLGREALSQTVLGREAPRVSHGVSCNSPTCAAVRLPACGVATAASHNRLATGRTLV